MSRIRLTWNNASTTIVEQRVYRSISPLDFDDMPAPLAVLPRRDREYLDSTIEDGLTYYYAVSSVLPDYSELISEVIKVEATPGADPHWDKVVALLHFDAGLTDVTGRVWVNHDSNLTFGVAPDGTSCLRIEQPYGVSAGVSCDASSDFNFTSDFTIECMVWSDSAGQNLDITSNTLGYWHSPGVTWRVEGGRERFVVYEPPVAITSSQIPTGGWVHLALVRVSNGILIFRDGVKVLERPNYYSGQVRFDYGGTRLFSYLGYEQTGAFNGYVKEYRATKGVARYTENFTPPTEPFPNN